MEVDPEVSRSSSRHVLSADRRLSRFQRVAWIALNLVNNAFPRYRVDRRIKSGRYLLPETRQEELWHDVAAEASPSRRLSDYFWLTMPWSAIGRELGPVRAFEMGCGRGTYGRLLSRILGPRLLRYLGVDIQSHADWGVAAPPLEFAQARAGDAGRFLDGANLLLTQSALEHFEEDLFYFETVAGFVRTTRRPLLQVHLVPTADCITTFPWHGIRQYTPRTISKITRLFGAETRMHLFSLGGTRCNRVHRQFITWPHLRNGTDQRRTRPADYQDALREAIRADFSGQASRASFYALVLVSHFDGDPFDEWPRA